MLQIKNILDAVENDRVRITDHADEDANSDNLIIQHVISSLNGGEIIEEYLTDKPFPSCLVFGRNIDGKPIHSVWA